MVNGSADYQRSVLNLVKNIGQAAPNREQLERDLLALNKSAMQVIQDSIAFTAQAQELKDGPPIADKLADMVIMLERLDYVQRLDYISLARFLENIDPELFEPTFRELMTYPGGEDRVRCISGVIGMILRESSTQETPSVG